MSQLVLGLIIAGLLGILRALMVSLLAGEAKGLLMSILLRRAKTAASKLPGDVATDLGEEWAEELSTLADRPLRAIRYTHGLDQAARTIADSHVPAEESPDAGHMPTVELVTLRDRSRLASLNLGPSAWESETAAIFSVLNQVDDHKDAVVRVAQDTTTGELIGAAAYTLRSPVALPATVEYGAEAAHIYDVGVRNGYRGLPMSDGRRLDDSLMTDVLLAIRDSQTNKMPPVWCIVAKENLPTGRLTLGHGFSCIASDAGEYDLWFRPHGLPAVRWQDPSAAITPAEEVGHGCPSQQLG